MPAPTPLRFLESRLSELARRPAAPYHVPGRWVSPTPDSPNPVAVHPAEFYAAAIRRILRRPPAPPAPPAPLAPPPPNAGPGDWGRTAVAYNMLVRYAAAFDHNLDGVVSPTPRPDGWRETGTFLKAIALLPHIRSLGCNVIHLLPVTSIGQDGNKGDMGSAFAIQDPYAIDPHLAEPALGVGPDAEFAAFSEAAHRLGIRIVVEFVFRTAAKDAAWAGAHPEWFYWIRADVPDRASPSDPSETAYGAPPFTPDELRAIYDAVGNGRFDSLLPPHQTYRDFFTAPPDPSTVHLENGAWRGVAPDPRDGRPVPVRIPGAFCDWGPDSTQPPWTDVTYLRLYDHPDFNYIAYNTVRMYDSRLAAPENEVTPLWNKIANVLPHYQRRFGIDGVMVDMGHALPAALKRQILEQARAVNPDFALWAEEFNISPALRDTGCNVCVGPFMQTVRNPQHFRDWLRWLHTAGVPVPFMAMAENHNTPRAVHWPGGAAYALAAQTLGAFLPGVPYLHNGVELAEPVPVNTGFDFTEDETASWPPSRLPLFSAAALDWLKPDTDTLVPALRRLHAVRLRLLPLLADNSPGTIIPLETANPSISGFIRQQPGSDLAVAVLANNDRFHTQPLTLPHPRARRNLLSPADTPLPDTLSPAQVVAYRL